MDTKTCSVCIETKPVTDFYKRNLKKDGTYHYDTRCKACLLESVSKGRYEKKEDENIVMPNGETRMANLMAKILRERQERIDNGGPKYITKEFIQAEKAKLNRSRGRTPSGLCGTTLKGGLYYCHLAKPDTGHRVTCGKGFKTRDEAQDKAARIDELKANGINDWNTWKLA